MSRYRFRRYGKKLDQLRDARGNRCQDCGETKDLEFAHVSPTRLYGRSRGQSHRYYDIVKHPEAYRLLCKRCHRRMDGFWGRGRRGAQGGQADKS